MAQIQSITYKGDSIYYVEKSGECYFCDNAHCDSDKEIGVEFHFDEITNYGDSSMRGDLYFDIRNAYLPKDSGMIFEVRIYQGAYEDDDSYHYRIGVRRKSVNGVQQYQFFCVEESEDSEKYDNYDDDNYWETLPPNTCYYMFNDTIVPYTDVDTFLSEIIDRHNIIDFFDASDILLESEYTGDCKICMDVRRLEV